MQFSRNTTALFLSNSNALLLITDVVLMKVIKGL